MARGQTGEYHTPTPTARILLTNDGKTHVPAFFGTWKGFLRRRGISRISMRTSSMIFQLGDMVNVLGRQYAITVSWQVLESASTFFEETILTHDAGADFKNAPDKPLQSKHTMLLPAALLYSRSRSPRSGKATIKYTTREKGVKVIRHL